MHQIIKYVCSVFPFQKHFYQPLPMRGRPQNSFNYVASPFKLIHRNISLFEPVLAEGVSEIEAYNNLNYLIN